MARIANSLVACALVLLTAASGFAAITTAVNPFGVPSIGTGVAIYASTSGTEFVTAQNWSIQGNIVNHDAPGTAGFLADPPKVQRSSETALANVFDSGSPGNPFETNDSYWGSHFTANLLGAGFNGSGGSNPDGSSVTTMELQGGTTFGTEPQAVELLVYLVITNPVTFSGELAIGTSTLESFGGILQLDGEIVPAGTPTATSSATPTATATASASATPSAAAPGTSTATATATSGAPQLPNGADCAMADQCESGFCADGVCCDAPCDGRSEVCDLAGRAGQCTLACACTDVAAPSPSTSFPALGIASIALLLIAGRRFYRIGRG